MVKTSLIPTHVFGSVANLAHRLMALSVVRLCLNEVWLEGRTCLGGLRPPHTKILLIDTCFGNGTVHVADELGLCERLSHRCFEVGILI